MVTDEHPANAANQFNDRFRADGNFCGYGGGLWRKKWLLDHEAPIYGRQGE